MTTENQTAKEPNPYNENKSWHQGMSNESVADATSLFIPPTKKTPEKEPVVENKPTTTETKEGEDKTNKRYFDLKAHHDKTVTELRNELKALKSKLDETSKGSTLPKNEEELDDFQKKNPDLFETVKNLSQLEVERQTKEVKAKLEEIDKQKLDLQAKEAESEVRKAVPDIDTLRESDDFHEWAESQTEEIQNWIYNNPYSSRNAIAAITLYKAEKGLINSQGQSKESSSVKQTNSEDAASLVSTRTQDTGSTQPKVWTPQEIKKMSLDEYEENKDEILKQLRSQSQR